jgi:hypothetical protein
MRKIHCRQGLLFQIILHVVDQTLRFVIHLRFIDFHLVFNLLPYLELQRLVKSPFPHEVADLIELLDAMSSFQIDFGVDITQLTHRVDENARNVEGVASCVNSFAVCDRHKITVPHCHGNCPIDRPDVLYYPIFTFYTIVLDPRILMELDLNSAKQMPAARYIMRKKQNRK